MGNNCCGTSSNKETIQHQRDYIIIMSSENHKSLHQQHQDEDEHEEEDDDDENNNNHYYYYYGDDYVSNTTPTPTPTPTPFQATPVNQIPTTNTTTTTTVLPLVDPRLVSLLDFCRQLRVRRKDIFNKLMPVHRQDFESIFNEMNKGQLFNKTNTKMGGVVRQRSLSVGDQSVIRLERFKVKPIASTAADVKPPPSAAKGPAGSKPPASNK